MHIRHCCLAPLSCIFLLLFLAGCSGGPKNHGTDGTEPRLLQFADCSELQEYLRDTENVRQEILRKRSNAVGGWSPALPVNTEGDNTSRQFSGTNIQEAGVDEPDIVKTDGNFVYLISGSNFLIFKAWPASDAEELARLEIAGNPLSLFVAHGLALVFSRIWRADLQEPEFNPMAGVITKLTLLDVTNPESPQLVRETFIEGDFLDARMVDNRVHLTTSSPIESNPQLADIPPSADDPTINDAAAFFPHYFTRTGQNGSATGSSAPVCTCENTFYPTIPRGLHLLTLFTLDLGDPLTEMKSVSIIGDPGQIYGSGESIYIASSADHLWMWWSIDLAGEKKVRETTVLHRFDIQGPSPVYAASGEVPGSVLNQFSMSEHEGLFRLATTEGGWWSDVISNRVFLLRQEEDRLQEISRLENLGKPGERIFAVRFLGHRGYVVTFEQVDPLYVLDLADPEAPRVTGELEVPGFSTYLHPAGEEMLLAVGRDGGQINLSLFDVSDPADPKLVHRVATGLYSWSEAEYEHKAFTYFAGRGILAVPITAWIEDSADSEQGTMFNGLHLYGVNLSASQNDAFSLLGTVDHASFYLDEEQDYWFFPASVRRSFFIGDPDGGDFLYSVSDRGMKINALADLAEVAALSLPAAPYWGEVAPMMGLAIAE